TVQTETQPAVVYETGQDLNVVAAQLTAGHAIEPDRDRYRDLTAMLTGQDPTVFSPFRGDRPIDHILYVGSDPLLLMRRAGRLTLTFHLAAAPDRGRLQQLLDAVVWEVGGETDWVPLSQPATVEPIQNGFVLTFNSFPGADLAPLAGAGL